MTLSKYFKANTIIMSKGREKYRYQQSTTQPKVHLSPQVDSHTVKNNFLIWFVSVKQLHVCATFVWLGFGLSFIILNLIIWFNTKPSSGVDRKEGNISTLHLNNLSLKPTNICSLDLHPIFNSGANTVAIIKVGVV